MKDWKEKITEIIDGIAAYRHNGAERVINIVEQLLDQQKQDLIKKIEGEKKETKIIEHGISLTYISTDHKSIGFNTALGRAMEIIRGEE